jgi:hypothetical protein
MPNPEAALLACAHSKVGDYRTWLHCHSRLKFTPDGDHWAATKTGYRTEKIMTEQLPASLQGKLPMPADHADAISMVPTIVTAFASIWFPPAGFVAAVLPMIQEQFLKRPQKLLMEALARGEIRDLSSEHFVQFVPMAYRFLEAAKQGEYEHTLRVLVEYLTGELKQEEPEAAGFARMARRVEGLSRNDLKVIALVHADFSNIENLTTVTEKEGARPFVAAETLTKSSNNKHGLTKTEITEALTEFSSRGFLIADGGSRVGKSEQYYFASQNLRDLMDRARNSVNSVDVDDVAGATKNPD